MCLQDVTKEEGVATGRRINHDWQTFQLGKVGDGLDGCDNQVRTLVQLSKHRHVLVQVETEVECVVDCGCENVEISS